MAFERLEPYGALVDDFRAGQICALFANRYRDPKKSEVYTAGHFMPALGRSMAVAEPVLLDDPKAHTRLLMTRVFGRKFKDG